MIEPVPSARPAGLRWIAILVALVLGCTTVRAPASAIGDRVPVLDGRAEPQLELWIESARAISPAESARAAAEARAALASAVAAHESPDGDALLVVRAQGIARTGSRRSSQRAAIAGMVVGAVVVVAVAVVMLVSGKGGSNGKGSPRAATPARGAARAATSSGAAGSAGAATAATGRASPGPRAALPGPPAGARPVPAPLPRRAYPGPVRPLRPAPAPWLGPAPVAVWDPGPYVGLDVWWGFTLDLTPGPYVAEGPDAATWEPLPAEAGTPWELPWTPPAAAASAPARPGDVSTVVLAPPAELRVGDRGFFAGDETVLELVWVDRHTGLPLRSKTVRDEVDPRDARAVGKLLDRALSEPTGWTPFEEPAPADEAPLPAG